MVLHAVWKSLHNLFPDLEQIQFEKYFCGHVLYLEYHKFAFCIIFEMKQDSNCCIVMLDVRDGSGLTARKGNFTFVLLQIVFYYTKVLKWCLKLCKTIQSGIECITFYLFIYKTASQIITGTFSLIRNARLSFPSRIPFRCFLFLFQTRWNPLLHCGRYKCWAFSETQRGLSAGLLLIYAPAVIL